MAIPDRYLKGGDLRSIARVAELLPLITTQADFDELFRYLLSSDRLLAMRAADAIEKITVGTPTWLDSHKRELLQLLNSAKDKELKWHLVLLVSRVKLSGSEVEQVWNKLSGWVKNKSESKIVRVNALQSLYDLSLKYEDRGDDLDHVMKALGKEGIPSINARIRQLAGKH